LGDYLCTLARCPGKLHDGGMQDGSIYQIYTEDLPRYRGAVEDALRKHGFEDYTMHPAKGCGPDQDGKQEDSLVVWVAVEDWTEQVDDRMLRVKDDICEHNGQNGQGSLVLVRIPAYPKLHKRRKPGDDQEDSKCSGVSTGTTVRKRATHRGRILAGFGEWQRLLGGGAIVEGRIVRFFPAS